MPERFDTDGVRDEPAHWDAIALRVAENAARDSERGAFEWLAQSRAGWIAASLLLAAALFSMTSAGDSASARGSDWMQVVAPGDDVGRQMAVSETPPAVSSLLVQTRGGT